MTTDPGTEAPSTEGGVETADVQSGQLDEGGIKALRAERDARKQADQQVAALQAQIDALNSEKLSDLERAQKAAADAARQADEATREALRYRYAAKYGISDDDAATFLTGSDEEAIKVQAERLAAMATAPKTPKPDLTQGGNSTPPAGSTAEQFAQFITKQLS